MPLELYRQTVLADCLIESLEEMMAGDEPALSEEVAMVIMRQFDMSVAEAFSKQVTAKASAKAQLKNYRYFDQVWTFWVDNLAVRLTGPNGASLGPELVCQHAKVVCVDAALVAAEEKTAAEQEQQAAGPAGQQAAAPAVEDHEDGPQ